MIPYTQESSGFTKKYQGLGLGLSIAKSCLELMEIDIDVEVKGCRDNIPVNIHQGRGC